MFLWKKKKKKKKDIASNDWPFADSENVACFTSRRILKGEEWIQYVFHDSEDGAWQFHPQSGTPSSDMALVTLRQVFDLDGSIGQLADLPLGWRAWRQSPDAAWIREPNT
ncbi:MAG: hypothetical protein AAF432_03350 [Planctomycetota bacterium]